MGEARNAASSFQTTQITLIKRINMVSIASYRGPGMAGGVSTALSTLWKSVEDRAHNWYFVCSKTDSIKKTDINQKSTPESYLSQELIKDHYRYCNDFIWPVMHDLGHFATYRRYDRERYAQFNRQFAKCIEENRSRTASNCFIQDYQLALTSNNFGGGKQIFWHIPWPKAVAPEFVEPIAEIAEGLLNCDSIGFHTREYADNFVDFVNKYFYGYSSTTFRQDGNNILRPVGGVNSGAYNTNRGRVRSIVRNNHANKLIKVLVAPLGLDLEYWQDNLQGSKLIDEKLTDIGLSKHDYILSVDRADYTKGVLERMSAIDYFYSNYPQWVNKVKFVQICGKTRSGLGVFENYWSDARAIADRVNEKWSNSSWKPIHWIDTPMNAKMLAGCYRNARVMLVNPIRDGLNLTAKEFIACQDENPGTLALSSGAGAYHEIGEWSVEANPVSDQSLASAVHESLSLSPVERERRASSIMGKLKQNTLNDWCNFFASQMRSEESYADTAMAKRYAKFTNRLQGTNVPQIQSDLVSFNS